MGTGLFYFRPDAQKDYSTEHAPTIDGYRELHDSIMDVRATGRRVDARDPDVQRAAAIRGKTVEDYLKYDLRQY